MSASGGCAVCADFKRNLVAVDEDETEVPSLSHVSNEVIAGLRTLIKRGKDLMLDPAKPKLFNEGARLMIAAGNTAAKVIDSARKLQSDGMAVIQAMGFIEKAQLFIEWYMSLPPAYRDKVRAGQAKVETDSSRAIPEKTGE